MFPGTSPGRAITCSGLWEPEYRCQRAFLLPPPVDSILAPERRSVAGGQGAHGFRQGGPLLMERVTGWLCTDVRPSNAQGAPGTWLTGAGGRPQAGLISHSQGRLQSDEEATAPQAGCQWHPRVSTLNASQFIYLFFARHRMWMAHPSYQPVDGHSQLSYSSHSPPTKATPSSTN